MRVAKTSRNGSDAMTDSELAVELRGVTKQFQRKTVRGGYTTLKTQLVGTLMRTRRERFEKRDIQVLNGIDLHPYGDFINSGVDLEDYFD